MAINIGTKSHSQITLVLLVLQELLLVYFAHAHDAGITRKLDNNSQCSTPYTPCTENSDCCSRACSNNKCKCSGSGKRCVTASDCCLRKGRKYRCIHMKCSLRKPIKNEDEKECYNKNSCFTKQQCDSLSAQAEGKIGVLAGKCAMPDTFCCGPYDPKLQVTGGGPANQEEGPGGEDGQPGMAPSGEP